MLQKRKEAKPVSHSTDNSHKNKKPKECQEVPKTNPLTHHPFSQNYFKLLADRSLLPAFQMQAKFLNLLDSNDVVIVQGETGSGKTTQIPQFLINSKWCHNGQMIACTQPRRIAAISVAKRVAEETDTVLGDQIGYCIRFEDKSSKDTCLKYMTDGMLIRELISDRWLSRYSVVILDEAHERTLNTDILLPILKDLLRKRNRKIASNEEEQSENEDIGLSSDQAPHAGPLKLIIMSATLEIERFVNYFSSNAPILNIPGRQFPVDVFYSKESEADYLTAAITKAVELHINEPPGDILIFLTGEEEIEFAVTELESQIKESEVQNGKFEVFPLFGSMSIENQQKVFERKLGTRKIIISTNIAETSITIDGIVFVIDCGLSKQKIYNPRFHFESLLVSPISKGNANQRAGRAGRTCPGKCFRLYTEKSYQNDLPLHSIPEILRSELSGTILNLFLLGIRNLKKFDWLESPSPETVIKGLEILVNVGAIDVSNGTVTLEGKSLGLFPLEPKMAKVLLKAKELSVVEECLDAIAVITSGNWRIRPHREASKVDKIHSKFTDFSNCDIMTTHNVVKGFSAAKNRSQYCFENFLNLRVLSAAMNVKNQLRQILFTAKTLLEDNHAFEDLKVSQRVKVAFLAGYYQQIGHLLRDGSYSIILQSHHALIHPSSTIKSKPDFILYLEFVLTSKNYLRVVSQIDPVWLLEMFPSLFDPSKIKSTDTKRALEKIKKEKQSK